MKNFALRVSGDIKVELSHKTSKKKILHFWFNTFFVCEAAVLEGEGENAKLVYTLNKCEIDDAHKDKEHKLFTEDFKVQLAFYNETADSNNHTTTTTATTNIVSATATSCNNSASGISSMKMPLYESVVNMRDHTKPYGNMNNVNEPLERRTTSLIQQQHQQQQQQQQRHKSHNHQSNISNSSNSSINSQITSISSSASMGNGGNNSGGNGGNCGGGVGGGLILDMERVEHVDNIVNDEDFDEEDEDEDDDDDEEEREDNEEDWESGESAVVKPLPSTSTTTSTTTTTTTPKQLVTTTNITTTTTTTTINPSSASCYLHQMQCSGLYNNKIGDIVHNHNGKHKHNKHDDDDNDDDDDESVDGNNYNSTSTTTTATTNNNLITRYKFMHLLTAKPTNKKMAPKHSYFKRKSFKKKLNLTTTTATTTGTSSSSTTDCYMLAPKSNDIDDIVKIEHEFLVNNKEDDKEEEEELRRNRTISNGSTNGCGGGVGGNLAKASKLKLKMSFSKTNSKLKWTKKFHWLQNYIRSNDDVAINLRKTTTYSNPRLNCNCTNNLNNFHIQNGATTTTKSKTIENKYLNVQEEDYYSSICDNQLSFNNSPCKSPHKMVGQQNHVVVVNNDIDVVDHVVAARPAKIQAIGFNVTTTTATAATITSGSNSSSGYATSSDTNLFSTPTTSILEQEDAEEAAKISPFVFPNISEQITDLANILKTTNIQDNEKNDKNNERPKTTYFETS